MWVCRWVGRNKWGGGKRGEAWEAYGRPDVGDDAMMVRGVERGEREDADGKPIPWG